EPSGPAEGGERLDVDAGEVADVLLGAIFRRAPGADALGEIGLFDRFGLPGVVGGDRAEGSVHTTAQRRDVRAAEDSGGGLRAAAAAGGEVGFENALVAGRAVGADNSGGGLDGHD